MDGYGYNNNNDIGRLKWTAWAKGGRVGVHPTLLAPKFFLTNIFPCVSYRAWLNVQSAKQELKSLVIAIHAKGSIMQHGLRRTVSG